MGRGGFWRGFGGESREGQAGGDEAEDEDGGRQRGE
jgi:hypothetical protein